MLVENGEAGIVRFLWIQCGSAAAAAAAGGSFFVMPQIFPRHSSAFSGGEEEEDIITDFSTAFAAGRSASYFDSPSISLHLHTSKLHLHLQNHLRNVSPYYHPCP